MREGLAKRPLTKPPVWGQHGAHVLCEGCIALRDRECRGPAAGQRHGQVRVPSKAAAAAQCCNVLHTCRGGLSLIEPTG